MTPLRQLWTPARTVGVIAFAVIGICIVILFAQNARQDAFDARRPADIQAAQDRTIRCLAKALRNDAEQTKDLREAAQLRDDDLVFAMEALVVMVRLRVLVGVHMTEETTQAARQFINKAGDFLSESERVEEARERNPVPDKICGVTIE